MSQVAPTNPKDVSRASAGPEQTRAATVYRPRTDIYEEGDHVVVVADMPGVAPADVDITLERRVLTIRGRSHLDRPDGYRLVYSEYGEGDYERVFTVSEDVDQDNIDATCKDGVLTLRLPKSARAKPRKIAVKS